MKKRIKILSVFICLILISSIIVSCSNFNQVKRVSKNLSAYEFDISINDETKVVDVIQNVKVINNYDVSLNTICFNVYARAFREGALVKPYTTLNEGKCFPNGVNYGDIEFESVKVNSKDTEFRFIGEDSNALEIKLSDELEAGNHVFVEFKFCLKLSENTHRLGFFNDSINLGNWFPILAVFEKGEYVTNPYYSTGDPFYSDIANYKATINYSNDYYLSATGEEKDIKAGDENNTATVEARAVRDFAIFLTKSSNVKAVKLDEVTINYVGYQNDNNIDNVLSTAKKAVKYFNNIFGKYPYKTLDIVKAPFVHGGMEYPSVVIISDSITNELDYEKVVIHEIAHQWWYAVVGNNEVDHAWLDESLAEYSSVLFLSEHKEFNMTYEELISEAFANYVLFADISASVKKEINTSMLLPVNKYNSEYEYSYMIYVKGVLLFDSVSQIVGKENLKKALRKYYSKFKFKIAKTDDLIGVIDNLTKKDVALVMDSWLNGDAVIGAI